MADGGERPDRSAASIARVLPAPRANLVVMIPSIAPMRDPLVS